MSLLVNPPRIGDAVVAADDRHGDRAATLERQADVVLPDHLVGVDLHGPPVDEEGDARTRRRGERNKSDEWKKPLDHQTTVINYDGPEVIAVTDPPQARG